MKISCLIVILAQMSLCSKAATAGSVMTTTYLLVNRLRDLPPQFTDDDGVATVLHLDDDGGRVLLSRVSTSAPGCFCFTQYW